MKKNQKNIVKVSIILYVTIKLNITQLRKSVFEL